MAQLVLEHVAGKAEAETSSPSPTTNASIHRPNFILVLLEYTLPNIARAVHD